MGAGRLAGADVPADGVQRAPRRVARKSRRARRHTWMRPAPASASGRSLNELLARTTDTNPYVNLSDGGHFDNLGLYEMIRRRCRTIVVVDAGADGATVVGDLANAMRRAHRFRRLDHVSRRSPLRAARRKRRAGAARRSPWARFDIRRPIRDDDDGVLLYLKPTILGDEPVDVANYAPSHPPFPHQPTANQWFDDAQFESYRALGLHTVCRSARVSSLPAFATWPRAARRTLMSIRTALIVGGSSWPASSAGDACRRERSGMRQAAALPAPPRAGGQNGLTDADRATLSPVGRRRAVSARLVPRARGRDAGNDGAFTSALHRQHRARSACFRIAGTRAIRTACRSASRSRARS